MTTKAITLPAIDFSQLRDGSSQWELVRKQVQKALEEYGCFEALHAGAYIDQNLRKSVFDGLKQLFDLPLPIKLKNIDRENFGHGYVRQHPMAPLYEGMAVSGADDTPGNIESFTNLMWSDGNPELRNSIESFKEQVGGLGKIVRRMVLESFGLEKYIKEHIDSTYDQIRVMKYTAPHSHETKLGVGAHKDMSVLTILCQNGINGLEIQTQDGQWIASNQSPDSVIVMAGDTFNAWTNGRVHSARHKVMMEGEVDRYSIGLFSRPKPGYMIKAPEEMVDEKHRLLYKPFDYDEYLKFFFMGIGRTKLEPLNAFCGVVPNIGTIGVPGNSLI